MYVTLWSLNSTMHLENPLSFSLFEEEVFGNILPVQFFLQGFENLFIVCLLFNSDCQTTLLSSLSLYERITVFLNT